MATKKCPNGHLYDSSIFEDKCPFCPSNYPLVIEDNTTPPQCISENDWESITKLIFERSHGGAIGGWLYRITFSSYCKELEIVREEWRKSPTDYSNYNSSKNIVVHKYNNSLDNFKILKKNLSLCNIYKKVIINQDGYTNPGIQESVTLEKNDELFFQARRDSIHGGDLQYADHGTGLLGLFIGQISNEDRELIREASNIYVGTI